MQQPNALKPANFEDLLEGLERVEDEFLRSLSADPSLFKLPGVMALTGQLKNAVRSMKSARDAVRVQMLQRPHGSDSSPSGDSSPGGDDIG